jgi:tricarballylate dehydrogenase
MTQEPSYDVLIVGAGNAGLCAAMAAQERGARIGLLEKAPREQRGGNSTHASHMRFAYKGVGDLVPLMKDVSQETVNAIAERLSARREADLWDEIMRVTEGQSDQDLVHIHVSESYKTIRWLQSKGHDWVPNYSDPTAGDVVVMNGGGYGLQERSFTFLERHGVTIHYDTSAIELLQDNRGHVTGVQALTPQGVVTFRAKAVVLACGGFESNAEMRARYLGPRWDTVKMRGVPYNTGEGLQMALGIGAMPYGSWSSCHASPQDLNRPAFSLPSSQSLGGREWNRYAYPFGILVNVHGQRFVDEGEDIRALTYAKMGRSILVQPQGVAFQIFDARARELGLLTAYGQASGDTANTLEGLAEKLGIDPAGLVETVQAFNAAIEPGPLDINPFHTDGKGTSDIVPPKSNYAMSIEQPPFEGYAVCCGITFTFGGLKVEPGTAQVQHVAGRPIPGLYTAGEMLGGLWHWNYPSGSGMMAGATFGRIAGGSAAKAALGQ